MLNNSHIKILFVCQNNTSLSPMAAQIFINMLRQLKILDRFTIDSAATSITEEGQSMNILAKEKLEYEGIEVGTHTSVQLKKEQYKDFDWIICMSEENMRKCYHILGNCAVYVTPADVRSVFSRDPVSPISLNGMVKPRVCRLLDFTDEHSNMKTPLTKYDYYRAFQKITYACKALIKLL